MRRNSVTHEFVEFIPKQLDEGVVYVSIEYTTAIHLCCCGCGNEVITPLSPTDWSLGFDGATISLHPSIGNGSFPCRSHYWIRGDKVVWAAPMTRRGVEASRALDRAAKAAYFGSDTDASLNDAPVAAPSEPAGFWARLKGYLPRR
jgi:hypothetical protein